MELENVILNQSQKNTNGMHSLIVIVSSKVQNKQVTIPTPQEAQEEGGLKWECFGSSEKGNKILTGAYMETKCRSEMEGKAMQRLTYLAIHPINNHQTHTLFC